MSALYLGVGTGLQIYWHPELAGARGSGVRAVLLPFMCLVSWYNFADARIYRPWYARWICRFNSPVYTLWAHHQRAKLREAQPLFEERDLASKPTYNMPWARWWIREAFGCAWSSHRPYSEPEPSAPGPLADYNNSWREKGVGCSKKHHTSLGPPRNYPSIHMWKLCCLLPVLLFLVLDVSSIRELPHLAAKIRIHINGTRTPRGMRRRSAWPPCIGVCIMHGLWFKALLVSSDGAVVTYSLVPLPSAKV